MFVLSSVYVRTYVRENAFSTDGQSDSVDFPEGWCEDALAKGAPLAAIIARVNATLLTWMSRLGGLAEVKVAATEAAAAEVVMQLQTVIGFFADASSTSPDGVGTLEAACIALRNAIGNEQGEASDDAVIADFPAIVLHDLLRFLPAALDEAVQRLESIEQATGHHRIVLASVLPFVDPAAKATLLSRAKTTHSAVRECKRKVKEVKGAIEYEKDGSDDDCSDTEERLQTLESEMIVAKKAYRDAAKAEDTCQTALARAFRDHLPELAYTHKKVADLTRRPVEIPLATDNVLENAGGVLRGSEHPSGVLSGRHPATFYAC